MITTNPFSLENKTIIITGASSGIGRQCAISCNQMGAKIVLIARNIKALEEVKSMLSPGNAFCFSYDLNDFSGIKELILNIKENVGKIDGLIHSAGVEKTLPLKMLKMEDFEFIYRLNFLSAMELVKNCTMKNVYNSGLKLVLISSISGIIGRKGVCAYSASKGALISSVKCLALELASKGININCVSPGTILTPMMERTLEDMLPELKEKRVANFPLGLGCPEDVANACIYLLSNASKWVTGTNLIVDGGYTAQ